MALLLPIATLFSSYLIVDLAHRIEATRGHLRASRPLEGLKTTIGSRNTARDLPNSKLATAEIRLHNKSTRETILGMPRSHRSISGEATAFKKWIDPFVAILLVIVLLATLLPCSGPSADFFKILANFAIVLLFFLHGAKLSREAILGGMLNWRLHLATLSVTFALFPLLGLVLIRLPSLDPALTAGVLYLTLLPSTVQSSIAFTSIAKGNVSAAVCAATLSNILGMFITPMLVALLMQVGGTQSQVGGTQSHVSMVAIWKIAGQLLLPFVVGHLARPWIGAWVARHKVLVGWVDRSSILLVVYTAFSEAVIGGLWTKCSAMGLLGQFVIGSVLLSFVLVTCWWLGGRLGLSREDAIVLLFCGSKKSLVSGIPMAGVLFPPAEVGLIILPAMIFHQIQLIVCAVIARRMGEPKTKKSPLSPPD